MSDEEVSDQPAEAGAEAGEPIIGIDLGTTNSLVAVMRDGQPQVLVDETGEARLPSVVSLDEGGNFSIGAAALARALDDPEDTVWSIKRLMGRSRADFSEEELAGLPFRVVSSERGLAQVELRGKIYTPEELSGRLLASLKERASAALGREIHKAVITVPAYFDDAQRQATRVAGQVAGLEVVRIVNEPTAAALAYGLDRAKSGRVVVYDLGGGTFDVSVLEIQDGLFRVRSTQGDTHLGGDDFDQVLAASLLDELGEGESPDPRLLQAVKRAAEKAKIHLSEHEEVDYAVEDRRSGKQLSARSTREEFEAAIAPLVDRTLQCCRRALRDAKVDRAEVGAVVLVGGSTRVPMVRRRVEEFFGRRPYVGVDPDRVVAIGAAVQADILDGRSRDLLLLDVIPLSLGIETFGGATAKIVMRNSPIPAQAQDAFTTSVDDQTAIDIHVLQGERELAKNCRSLGRLKLRVPPMTAGMARVDVQFLVDENGVLEVRATDRQNGHEAMIEIVPSYGLNDEEIARVVTDSFQFAREDMQAHQRIDLINECRTMIRAVDKLLLEGGHGLADAEVEEVRRVRAEVEAGIEDPDVPALKLRYDRFVQATVPLAGAVMTEVAQAAVKGRTIDEVLGEEKDEEKECGDLGEGFRSSPGPRAASDDAPKGGSGG